MTTNEFSITAVVPTLDSASTIMECLQSIFDQTLKPQEIIVVDNGSRDMTVEIVGEMSSMTSIPIHILAETSRGSGPARNLGVSFASSKFIAFLDSDDIWENEKLEKQILHHVKTEKCISGTFASYVNLKGRIIGNSQMYQTNFHAAKSIYIDRALPFLLSSWIISKQEFIKLGMFNPQFEFAQDYEFFQRALNAGFEIKIIPQKYLKYRISANSSSSKHYVRQYLNAQYAREKKNKDPLFLEEYINGNRTLSSKVYRVAMSGYYLRKAMTPKSKILIFYSFFCLIISFLLSPKRFIEKLRTHGSWNI